MQVLVIGGGGREHALVWKIKQSPRVEKIFCAPGNAGTAEIAENISIAADNIKDLLDFAIKKEMFRNNISCMKNILSPIKRLPL